MGQQCILKWLGQRDGCPLCRGVVVGEEEGGEGGDEDGDSDDGENSDE